MKKTIQKNNLLSFLFYFLLVGIFSLSPIAMPVALAASTTIELTPASGTYTVAAPVTIDLVIDGRGDTFNAAQATLTLSRSLLLTDLTLGDCNFSFVITPTASNPSFTGVLLGTSSRKCTVYTLTLLPVSAGSGTITISDAAVKQYKTAREILVSSQNGSYTINPSSDGTRTISLSPTPSTTQSKPPLQNGASGLYSLIIKAVSAENTPLSAATVVLESPGGGPRLQAATDEKGIARFSNVTQGVYSATVKRDNTLLAKTVLNVDGANPSMTLGIKSQSQPLDLTIIILGIILALSVIFFFIKVLRGRKNTVKETPKTS